MPWLDLPLPSLICLHVVFENARLLHASRNSFPKFSPNIRDISFYLYDNSDIIEPNYICHWQNLCSVDVLGVVLDMDDLVHLSRTPMLTHLKFTLNSTLLDPNFPLSCTSCH